MRLDRTGSTNRDVLDLAREGEPAGLVLVASEQTAGRGRQGRAWLGSAGRSLTFSVLRRPEVPATEAFRWTLMVGLAARQAVGCGVWLKWPNDLFVGDRKLGGVLCELQTLPDRGLALVLGVGINLRPPAAGWPEELEGRATSIEESSGTRHDTQSTEELLQAFLRGLEAAEESYREQGPGPLMQRSREAMGPLLGRTVQVELGTSVVSARVTGLGDNGALEVVDDGGRSRQLLAGDVHLGGVGCSLSST